MQDADPGAHLEHEEVVDDLLHFVAEFCCSR